MRLQPEQVALIKQTVATHFGADVPVWLFGSRVDDGKKGGDVDLYLETECHELIEELRCKIHLQEQLDLHVDLVISHPGSDHPIYRIAKTQGVRL